MCLILLGWQTPPGHRLVLAANRDEFHDRPAEAAHWWAEPGLILGGKDLQAGGAWLGLDRRGRYAVVTNYREPGVPTSGKRSRGELVASCLASSVPLSDWLEELDAGQDDYGGYNLIVGDEHQMHYLTNRGDDRRFLGPGIYGLSNHRLDTPWPKVVAVRTGLHWLIDDDRVDPDALFELLADREPAPDDELPHTGVPLEWERALSAAFIVGEDYGTRASTVVLVTADGGVVFEERRFGPGGIPAGDSRFSF